MFMEKGIPLTRRKNYVHKIIPVSDEMVNLPQANWASGSKGANWATFQMMRREIQSKVVLL